jgi:hypothetical protein
MTNTIRRSLLCAAALALIIGPGLSSCSDTGEQAGNEQAAGEESAAGPAGPGDLDSETATNAKALLKKMSDYLAAQQNISLSYDSVFEVVSDGGQKLQLTTSGTIDLVRPDKIRTARRTGFSDTEMVYDGTTLTLFGKGQNAYIQTEAPGTIDSLVDQLREKFQRPIPGADLLVQNVYDALMDGVTDVKDLGSGVINGQECDHLAFRSEETDWQIWIAHGENPYPCRYVITSRNVDQAPQFTMVIREWNAGAGASAANFSFTPPAGARELTVEQLKELKETSDLPDNYRIGAEQ